MGNLKIRSELDEFEAMMRGVKTYPLVVLKNPSDELAVLILS